MKYSILLTGSNGLLGQKLVSLLAQQADVDLIATSKGNNRIKDIDGYRYFPMDICNPKEVNAVFASTQPTTVIHTAAITQVDTCEKNHQLADQVNIEGTRNLIEAATHYHVHFIYLSTDFVFDGEKGMYTEESLPNPPNYYGETKLAAEKLVQSSQLKWSIVRTVLVYGILRDMSRSNIILWVKKNLEAQKSIRVVEDQWRTPTFAEDLAKGCWLIAQQKATGIFNICGKDLLTPYQIAIKTAHVFQLDDALISPTNASAFKEVGKRPPKTGLNIQKAKQLLAYEPHSFQEGLLQVKQQLDKVKTIN